MGELRRKWRGAAVTLVLASLVAGCGPDDATALVNDLAARMDRTSELTFTAEYRLADGTSAVIAQAQDPRRAAYTHGSGKVVLTDDRMAQCRTGVAATTRMRCVLTTPSTPAADPVLDILSRTEGASLVSPVAVVRRLTTAIEEGATVTRHDATIAGTAAKCVGVHGSAGFTACLTEDGLLGSFAGIVDGVQVDIELVRYERTTDGAAFELPAGAEVEDRRAR